MYDISLRWCLPRAAVGCDIVEASEDLEGRITLDTVFLAQFRLLCAVNFGQRNVLLFQLCGSFFVLGGEGFAVAAPRCENWGRVSSIPIISWQYRSEHETYTLQEPSHGPG